MKKPLKITLISLLSVLGVAILVPASYVGYVYFSYYRIGNTDLTPIEVTSSTSVKKSTTYSCSTYNVGFGAYSQDYTFFLDTGYDDNGNATCGHYSTARSKEEVLFNIQGASKTINELGVDFAFFQEVDTNSTRSYHVNQNEIINKELNGSENNYDNVFCSNFHSAYMMYPLYDMHGASNAGIATYSKYKINKVQRKEYTISTSFSKFFDLDRCFSVSTVSVEGGKNLYLINNHMSAYDEGGIIREKQMKELYSFADSCYKNGDYVVIGGDFNHDLITYNPEYNYDETTTRPFNMTKKTPDWVSYVYEKDGTTPFGNDFTVIGSDNTPSCRNNDIEWEEGKTFTAVVDGFVVSDNVEIVSHKNIKTKQGKKGIDGFAFSDHDPAYLEFKLK